MAFFSSLTTYTVHLKPGDSSDMDALRFVPETFCWLAFIFTTLWALYHRLWWMAGIMIAANAALVLSSHFLGTGEASLSILQIGLHLWAGFQGHDFLRARLRKDGFITAAIVSGESKSRAEQRFFDKNHALLSA